MVSCLLHLCKQASAREGITYSLNIYSKIPFQLFMLISFLCYSKHMFRKKAILRDNICSSTMVQWKEISVFFSIDNHAVPACTSVYRPNRCNYTKLVGSTGALQVLIHQANPYTGCTNTVPGWYWYGVHTKTVNLVDNACSEGELFKKYASVDIHLDKLWKPKKKTTKY